MNQKVAFTSDAHFSHKNIIKYCSRPVKDENDMNEVLINRWNEKIDHDTDVYHLGDVFFGDKDIFRQCLDRLNFHNLNIVLGNHDENLLKFLFPHFYEKGRGIWEYYGKNTVFTNHITGKYQCITILPPQIKVKVNKQSFVLSHYPMESWDGDSYGSIHLFGHVHNTLPQSKFKRMDVGVDTNDLAPYLFEEVMEVMKDREIRKFV